MPSTPPGPGLALALVRLPGQMRRALRTFHKITGLTAVTSLAASFRESVETTALSPPVHPRCTTRLRSARTAPCKEQWLIHMRKSRRSSNVESHICPIGLRCSCVPIWFDSRLVGVAKLVVDSEISDAAFSAAKDVLKLVVSETCKGSLVAVLSEEVGALRKGVVELQQVRSKAEPPERGSEAPVATPGSGKAELQSVSLVERALAYLQQHYQEPHLSLATVAKALGCNPMYLTNRFTQIVGDHMHRYLVGLRVAHACRLLMDTDLLVKETACASGFLGSAPLARAFRRHVGVSPAEYRRIFTAP